MNMYLFSGSFFQLCVPLGPQIHQLAHMRHAQLRQRDRMLGRVEDYLALAVRRLYLIQLRRHVVRLRRIGRQRREVVVVL